MPRGFWTITAETIYRRIGNCPGDLSLYHVDHIVPLAAFGAGWKNCWISDSEVLTLLHPDNYRWLTITDNLKKNSYWDKRLLTNWLKAHPSLRSRRYHFYDYSYTQMSVTRTHCEDVCLQVQGNITGMWVV
jgi:hypothetical protein